MTVHARILEGIVVFAKALLISAAMLALADYLVLSIFAEAGGV